MSTQRPTVREIFFSPNILRSEHEREEFEREFFAKVSLKNGVFKITCVRRLDDLNELVLNLLPQTRPVQLMDVAISSGITTMEWARSLDEQGIEYRMYASDAVIQGYLVSLTKSFEMLVDET